MRHVTCFGLALACTGVLACAAARSQPAGTPPVATQPANDPNSPRVTRLTVYPAAPPEPALKYRLLPTYRELTDENGALMYYQAVTLIDALSKADPNVDERVAGWLSLPPQELPRGVVRELLGDSDADTALRYAGYGARCSYCDWGFPARRSGEGIHALMPSLAPTRTLARLIALKARVQVADGEFESALDTLATGYALARDAGGAPVLIASLIGIASGAACNGPLRELMQAPQGPNLYWALAAFPQPLVDMRRAWEGEGLCVETTYPLLAERHRRELTPDECTNIMREILSIGTAEILDPNRLLAESLAYEGPKARNYLAAHGYSPEKLAAMKPSQLVLAFWLDDYRHWLDDEFKWFALPYWQAAAGSAHSATRRDKVRAAHDASMLTMTLMPSWERAAFLRTSLERDLALLRTVEALRAQLAEHEALPETLADVTDWPIPLDPVHGESFEYHVTGDVVILESPPPPGGR